MTIQAVHSRKMSGNLSREHAETLDQNDSLKHFREEFIIPTKADLKRKTLAKSSENGEENNDLSIYLCGNSLGLQPRRTSERISSHLTAWATKGVLGHFTEHDDFSLPSFIHTDETAAEMMTSLVGASREEVAVMETLTANLHFLMSSFYRPTKEKYKIILEGKAFPSDHYAVESQILHHDLDPKNAMILIEPADSASSTVTTSHVLSIIDAHASSTALILLPGIQYYTGQYFDIKTITEYARSKDILIGWDLAHAAGNMDLKLHEWDVDFAAWCTYKYINSGPGSIAAIFVHEKHGRVNMQAAEKGKQAFRPRLSGWWGGDKATRFAMGNRFVPIPGAAGYQVGNPSALALTAVIASLEIFSKTSMKAIRGKSVALTGYLEQLLLQTSDDEKLNPYRIITPSDPNERGAQLSVRLDPGLLEGVMAELESAGVVVDERKPDVIRVAPAPLYNTYIEVWEFVQIFKAACTKVKSGEAPNGTRSVIVEIGGKARGWSQVE